jgi:hypothetical protein
VLKRRQRRFGIALGGLVLSIGLVACTHQGQPTPGPSSAEGRHHTSTADKFGIRYLYPSLPGGMNWESNWGKTATFDKVDPNDAWFDVDHGTASYRTQGGMLYISGESPRMYVHDPRLTRQWKNVEVTMYFMRVADADVPYAGMTAVARANHGVTGDYTQDLCDTRGYGARMRYDGQMDFEKETSHPHNQATDEKTLFPDGMPRDHWIGYKFVVYDLTPSRVKLELWADLKNNGQWRKVNEMVDDGHVFGNWPCKSGINPRMVLNSSPNRPGSESGKPNISVYFRSDGVAKDGLVYRNGSVREIQAPE